MKTLPLVIALGCLAAVSLNRQLELRIDTLDADTEEPLAHVQVEELLTGKSLTTDGDGFGMFHSPFHKSERGIFRLTKLGHPTGYAERMVMDYGEKSVSSNYELVIGSSFQMVSDVLEGSGAEGSATISTDQWAYRFEGDPKPKEYRQAVHYLLPSGALAGPYRIGLRLMHGLEENNISLVEMGNLMICGQFRFSILDDVNQPSPVSGLKKPLRIRMTPGSLGIPSLLAEEKWPVRLYRFDEATLVWRIQEESASGIDEHEVLWAEIDTPGIYSFFAKYRGVDFPESSEAILVQEEK